MTTTKITVQASAIAPVAKVWEAWNDPQDILQWNAADPTWHCTTSENNLFVGGRFKHRMEAKDGSCGFDFEGKYDAVELNRELSYTMPDGRVVTTWFAGEDEKTSIKCTFDAETENDPDLQKQGWQAILNNFVNYVESKGNRTK